MTFLSKFLTPFPQYIHLERGIVRVAGTDAARLLQGLTTNDVYRLEPGQAQYSSFLNHKGRVLFEFFVVREGEGSFLLECQRPYAEDLYVHLLTYKLKAQVEMSIASEKYKVYCTTKDVNVKIGNGISYADRRCDWGLTRHVVPADVKVEWEGKEGERSNYRALRCVYGVPEGMREVKWFEALPHEYNLDLMGGISFHKGCYLGQELVSRVHHQGVVRKRVLPVRLHDPMQFLEMGELRAADEGIAWEHDAVHAAHGLFDMGDTGMATRIRTDKDEIIERGTRYDVRMRTKAGTLVRLQGNIALALMRLDVMKSFPLIMFNDLESGKHFTGVPYIPSWWPKNVLDNVEPFNGE